LHHLEIGVHYKDSKSALQDYANSKIAQNIHTWSPTFVTSWTLSMVLPLVRGSYVGERSSGVVAGWPDISHSLQNRSLQLHK